MWRMVIGIAALMLTLNGSASAQATWQIVNWGSGSAGAPGSLWSYLEAEARTKKLSGTWTQEAQSEVYVDTVTLGGCQTSPIGAGCKHRAYISTVSGNKVDTLGSTAVDHFGYFVVRGKHYTIITGGAWNFLGWSPATLAEVPPPPACDESDPTCTGSPILIPLGKSPEVKVSSLEDGVVFDIDGDGNAENVSWPVSDAGFLAIDLNNNGVIDNGGELFGNAGGSVNGFQKLLEMVGPLPPFTGGVGQHGLDASFPIFSKLLVWHDKNRDGYSQPDEIEPASKYLTKISLNYKIVGKKDNNGNRFKYQGWIDVPSGGRRPIYDVFFVVQ